MAGLGGLVAYDGSGSSSEDEEEMMADQTTVITDETSNALLPTKNIVDEPTTSTNTISGKPVKSSVIFSKFFDDDDDEDTGMELDSAINADAPAELEETPIWSKFLPQPKKVVAEFEEAEDDVEVGPIPPKKNYGDETLELPPPKSSTVGSITATKVQGKVRISIPFLNSIDEDNSSDETDRRRLMQPSQKGSGLFAILPQPKNSMSSDSNLFTRDNNSKPATTTTTPENSSSSTTVPASTSTMKRLVPDSVKNRLKRPCPEKISQAKSKYIKKVANSSGPVSSSRNSDGSDEEDGGSFFALDSTEIIDPEALEKLKLPTPDFTARVTAPVIPQREESMDTGETMPPETSTRSNDLMQFIRPKKGKKEDVQIIDINADDLRPDNTEWLKNITDESAVPVRRSKGLGGMVKRKHQITYLAFEAKAREQELKNQWAENRANKMATKNKYGF